MNEVITKELTIDEIEALSSHYISEGESGERWKIKSTGIAGDELHATACMTAMYESETDENGFHLSFFTASKIVSQLVIIYLHHWAGLTKKSREVWMVEFHSRHHYPVRDSNEILVAMKVNKIRQRDDKVYIQALYTISDKDGGLFEIEMKNFMS